MPRHDSTDTSTAKEFNKARAAFMRRASAPHLSPYALKLAYLIAFKHMDNPTRTARPSQDTLAADLGGVTVRTVQRMLDVLRPLGLVIVPGHGPKRASTYWIDPNKATPVSPIGNRNATPVSPIGNRKHDSGRQKTRLWTTEKATPESPLLNKNLQQESPREEVRVSAPDVAALDSGKQADVSEPKSRKKKKQSRAAADAAAIEAAFEEFWRVYPRKVAKEAARRAHVKAIEGGANPAVLISGAERYAIERKGQDPKYTKHPATWLNAGCWLDELPGAPIIDNQTGDIVAFEQPQAPPQHQRQRGILAVAEELARKYEEKARLNGHRNGGRS